LKSAIDIRELITLEAFGGLVRGTYHRSHAYDSVAPSSSSGIDTRPGILFLNSLSLPRAATGDSSVYWADAFAAAGYPTFRIDLPGLGDSSGEIPGDLLDYLNSGGYGQVTSALIKELVARFSLAGVIIIGHCAGAVSAIYAAAASKECKGLVLLDPYFHLNQAVRPKVRQELSVWARRSAVGSILSNVYDRLRDLSLHLKRNSLPKNANRPLLNRWKEVSSAGLPILYLKAPGLKAPGTKPRVGEFDYLKHILDAAGRRSQVIVQLIEGTDHSFANRRGRAVVRECTELWLSTFFALPGTGAAILGSVSHVPGYNEPSKTNQESCQIA
jgi:pimeloyl-ACP methyl ester carboxylesterase